ncbi:hypothetical protein ASC93_19245 [Massilia sp. Root335]|nr:hypothetical protein ASC93_19245 [Massilia sp. Root335]
MLTGATMARRLTYALRAVGIEVPISTGATMKNLGFIRVGDKTECGATVVEGERRPSATGAPTRSRVPASTAANIS